MLTPVNLYLKVRDVYAGAILLESSDYHGHENSRSFICCKPLARLTVHNDQVTLHYPDGSKMVTDADETVPDQLQRFVASFREAESGMFSHAASGLFGYTAYDAARYFDRIDIRKRESDIPDMVYAFYQVVMVIDHFHNELLLIEHTVDGVDSTSHLDHIETLLTSSHASQYPFTVTSEETSSITDAEFLELVETARRHCLRGDVFQLVLSRRFATSFQGDEFNVYRALRSINPSPYLFYFDYGNFKLFGSSPEAQIQIANRKASVYPIAGTYRRTGNDQEDLIAARRLSEDEKENAEHLMLVDLARNDVSRHAEHVGVEVFKEVQVYSHVIHLVSKVSGTLAKEQSVVRVATDTFPAGTLSGAPKHKAMQLIDRYEPVNRGFYGGAIGFIGFNQTFNHAIMIRTFLSRDNKLMSQAGAGIVAKSSAAAELQEVNNKLQALRRALAVAETLHV